MRRIGLRGNLHPSGYHVLVPAESSLYCDVSLPVPLDQPFTYALPETLRHRVREGSRIAVPFGAAQTDRRDSALP